MLNRGVFSYLLIARDVEAFLRENPSRWYTLFGFENLRIKPECRPPEIGNCRADFGIWYAKGITDRMIKGVSPVAYVIPDGEFNGKKAKELALYSKCHFLRNLETGRLQNFCIIGTTFVPTGFSRFRRGDFEDIIDKGAESVGLAEIVNLYTSPNINDSLII